ncbi:MAG: helix-turn-helix domain-containing protein [Planctomycetota bacterium]
MPDQVLDDAAWQDALDDPRLQLTPTLGDFARGRVRMVTNWDTAERKLDAHLVYACRQGRISARLGGSWHHLHAGAICLVPPQVSFRFLAQEPPVLARFRLRIALGTRTVAWGRSARIVAMDAALERLVDLLVDELHADADSALAADIARAFCRAFARMEDHTVGVNSGPRRLTGDQMAVLSSDLARRPCAISPRDLAHRLRVSPDWASRLIRATTGLSPRAWIVRERIRIATDLLSQGLTPTAVAQRLGYQDPRLFGRQFRSVLGCPPGVWQRRVQRE